MMYYHLATVIFALLAVGNGKPASDDSSEQNTSEERGAIGRLKQHFEDACTRNSNSSVTYADVIEAVSETTVCFGFKLDFGEFLSGWRHLNDENREEFFTKYCPLVKNTTLQCLEPVEELSKLCLNPGAQRVEAPDFPMYLLPQVVDLVCEDNGAIFFASSAERPFDCFENYFGYIQRCMKNFVSETSAKSRGDYGEPECRVLEKSRECVRSNLEDCGSLELIRMFDVPYKAIVRETECRNFLRIPDNN
ncbi:uncharacterized protein LOC135706303 [Ochlerotatus camptorhynchus]|uniref:uncharacterized protein LOC135706303 n=1 Tax=Ochlerotatus camptorhynchus TaxID=644619 RepID=UPI0031D02CA2